MHGIYSDEQRDQIIAEHVNIVNVHEARLAALGKSLDRLNAESQLAVTQQKRAAAEDLMQKYSKFVNDGDQISHTLSHSLISPQAPPALPSPLLTPLSPLQTLDNNRCVASIAKIRSTVQCRSTVGRLQRGSF